MGPIQMKGCNGNAILANRLEVGIERFHKPGAISPDDKKFSSPAVFFLLHGIPIDSLTHTSDPIRTRCLFLGRDIDVQEGVAGKALFEDVAGQSGGKGGRMVESKILPPHEGNGKGRDAQNRSFDRR